MDDTRFIREIMSQPDALRDLAGYYNSIEGSGRLDEFAAMAGECYGILATGMGTSLYAPYLLKLELAESQMEFEIIDAAELLHFGLANIREIDMVIAVSQSGESAETKRVAESLSGKARLVAIVNNTDSSMARAADIVLPLCAGDEASISTKTYSNTLALLYLLSSRLRGEDSKSVIDELIGVADDMEKSLDLMSEKAVETAAYFGNMQNLHVIARGRDLVTARQLALIIKEGAGVFSEALSAGLFRHGPVELTGEGHSALFIASKGCEPELTVSLAEETARNGSRVAVLSDGGEYGVTQSKCITLKSTHPRYFPLLCAPYIELFVHETAKAKGREAGVFRHVTKITDRE